MAMPLDRDSRFEPELVKEGPGPHCSADDKVIGLYASGLMVRDIQAHLLNRHGLTVSSDLIDHFGSLISRWFEHNGERRGSGTAKPGTGLDVPDASSRKWPPPAFTDSPSSSMHCG